MECQQEAETAHLSASSGMVEVECQQEAEAAHLSASSGLVLVIVLVIVIVIVIVATMTMVIVSAHQPTSASLYFVPARQVPWTQDCPY